MRIIYPYNEILPKRTAHDIYVVNNCLSLAEAGMEVELICGAGSLYEKELLAHYHGSPIKELKIEHCPIVRNNNILGITWNRVFFFFSQKYLQRQPPDFLMASVLKQANYHFSRKLPGVQYIYEVHGLKWYPNQPLEPVKREVDYERSVLEKADLITVTTQALKEVLKLPPYSLTNRIEIVPLAAKTQKVDPPPARKEGQPLTIMYVGQLYKNQGVSFLLKALSKTKYINLEIIGGKEEEIKQLRKECIDLHIESRVSFHGFYPPSKLIDVVKHADVFVTSFEPVSGMPYVAHTKLHEYAAWGRPIIAPDLSVVKEYIGPKEGALLYQPGCLQSLIDCLGAMLNPETYNRLREEIRKKQAHFSWHCRAKNYQTILESILEKPKNKAF